MNTSIPKIVHYCWFGGNEIGESGARCIETWKRFLPDYQIIRWDESNFDVGSCCYCAEAYEAKKWAFVSDYARFKILYKYGGIYLDTDVEILSNYEEIIDAGPFMGIGHDYDPCEVLPKGDLPITVNPGNGLGITPGHELYKDILDSYESSHFVSPKGDLNLETVVERVTKILIEHGLMPTQGIQEIDGIQIYPAEYLCPLNYSTGKLTITDNTFSIHHFDSSWLTKQQLFEHRLNSYFINHGVSARKAKQISAILEIVLYADIPRIVRKLRSPRARY